MEDNYIIMRRKEQMLSHSYLTEVLDYNAETGKFVWKNLHRIKCTQEMRPELKMHQAMYLYV